MGAGIFKVRSLSGSGLLTPTRRIGIYMVLGPFFLATCLAGYNAYRNLCRKTKWYAWCQKPITGVLEAVARSQSFHLVQKKIGAEDDAFSQSRCFGGVTENSWCGCATAMLGRRMPAVQGKTGVTQCVC